MLLLRPAGRVISFEGGSENIEWRGGGGEDVLGQREERRGGTDPNCILHKSLLKCQSRAMRNDGRTDLVDRFGRKKLLVRRSSIGVQRGRI